MSFKSARKGAFWLVFCLIFLSASFTFVKAQTEDEVKDAMVKGLTLFKQEKYVEALPYLELLVKAMPDEPQIHFLYGFSLVAKSKQIAAGEDAKKYSAKALEEFKTAKKLGLNDEANDTLIKLLSGETVGENSSNYSKNAEAEKYMNQAESYFAQSNYDEALTFYQKALALDPNIYEAALYSGDAYTAKEDWENAEKSYQKAIAIDPNRETAYRYSGTPLMKQKKYDAARDRYIEAFITEPYNNMSLRGISQWADVTGAKLGHPKIEFPKIEFDTQGQAKMAASVDNPNYNPEWKTYTATRIIWRKEKFARTFPNEKQYRHTLQEEAEAIRSAIKSAKESKSTDPKFATLEKIDNDGLLEAYILLAIPDDGIAEDHPAYLKTNRAKLRQYVLKYVITAG